MTVKKTKELLADLPGGAEDFSDLDKMIKETPLKIRLKVSNEMAFISLLTELGYRENKGWTDSENEILSKLCKSALAHTEHQLEQIEEFNKDRRSKADEEIENLRSTIQEFIGRDVKHMAARIEANKIIEEKDNEIEYWKQLAEAAQGTG